MTNFRLFSIIGFLVLLIISIPITLNLVSRTQDTRSKASEVNLNKIKFKFSIEEVKNLRGCFTKTNELTVDILNPISKSSQIGSTVIFYPIEGQFNSKGYQIFQTEEIVLNSSFNSTNNFNYLKVKTASSLKTVLCLNQQKNKITKNSECNINLSNDTIYDFSEYPLIIGDVNNDTMINVVDFSYVKNKLNADLSVSCDEKNDFNFDGVVNTIDLALIKKNIFINDEDILVAAPSLTPTAIISVSPTISTSPTLNPTNEPTPTLSSSPTIIVPTETPDNIKIKKTVLFVGNSKTHRETHLSQSIANIFTTMANTSGYEIDVTKATINSSTLLNTYNLRKSVISSKVFDVVVLQEQTASAEGSNVTTFLNGAKKIKELVIAKNPNVNIFLRTSWGLKANLGTGIQTRMYNNVNLVASKIEAKVILDGKTFDSSLKNYPSIAMYSDTTHQSNYGAYLAAACVYKTVLGADPRKVTYYGFIDESTAKIMQEVAYEICE